jgi:hypothetical protein
MATEQAMRMTAERLLEGTELERPGRGGTVMNGTSSKERSR